MPIFGFWKDSLNIILGRNQFGQEEENTQSLKVSQEWREGEFLTGLFPCCQHVKVIQGLFPRLANALFRITGLPGTLPNNNLLLFLFVVTYFLTQFLSLLTWLPQWAFWREILWFPCQPNTGDTEEPVFGGQRLTGACLMSVKPTRFGELDVCVLCLSQTNSSNISNIILK